MAIFLIGMTMIVFEAQLEMDKFKPAMLLMSGLIVIGVHYAVTDPTHLAHFLEARTTPRKNCSS